MLIWSLGVLVTQITTDKRPLVKLFNVGVGILGGGVAAAVVVQRPRRRRPRAPSASCSPWRWRPRRYFATDFLLSAVSVAIETDTPVARAPGAARHALRDRLLRALRLPGLPRRRGRSRSTPWWTLILLAVPLATLLVATRAVTRGGENARRLSVLFDAAVRAQTLSDTRQVVDALTDDARRLLRIKQVEVRATPPGRPRDRRPAARRPAGPLDRGARPAPGPVDHHRRPAGPRGDGRGLLRRLRAAPADRGHDPPRPPRPAHQPAQPRPAARPGRARAADVAAPRHPDRAALRRPRRLQAGQRPLRPRRRRRGADRRGRSG